MREEIRTGAKVHKGFPESSLRGEDGGRGAEDHGARAGRDAGVLGGLTEGLDERRSIHLSRANLPLLCGNASTEPMPGWQESQEDENNADADAARREGLLMIARIIKDQVSRPYLTKGKGNEKHTGDDERQPRKPSHEKILSSSTAF